MSLKLDQSLVCHACSFYANFIPAHLSGRKNCSLNVLWLGWFHNPSTWNIAWLQNMSVPVPYCPLPRVFARVTLRFLGIFIALGFYLSPKMSPITVISVNSLSILPLHYALISVLTYPQSTSIIYSISPLQGDSCIPPLSPHCYLASWELRIVTWLSVAYTCVY